jgi:hypothetical protein
VPASIWHLPLVPELQIDIRDVLPECDKLSYEICDIRLWFVGVFSVVFKNAPASPFDLDDLFVNLDEYSVMSGQLTMLFDDFWGQGRVRIREEIL